MKKLNKLNKLHKILVLFFATSLLFYSCKEASSTSENYDLSAVEFAQKIKEMPEAKILDVRTPEEFGKGHLVNAMNCDWNGANFDQEVSKLDKEKPVFIYCLSGGRSGNAASKMREDGFKKVYELNGGIIKWRAENFEETTDNKVVSEGLSLEAFQSMIKSNPSVVFDFYADWCEPCIKMKPFLMEVESEYAGKTQIIRINADDNQALLKALKINGLPEVQVYKNGQMTWQHNGYCSKEDLLKAMN